MSVFKWFVLGRYSINVSRSSCLHGCTTGSDKGLCVKPLSYSIHTCRIYVIIVTQSLEN